MKKASSVSPLHDEDVENSVEKSSRRWPFSFGLFGSKKQRLKKNIAPVSSMAMLLRIARSNEDESPADNGINNSLVSLGIAMATSTTKDIHQVCPIFNAGLQFVFSQAVI